MQEPGADYETADQLAELYEAALVSEKTGNAEQAAELYRQCLALDPTDTCGASVRIASLGLGDAPDKAPDAYVAMLFDQHAEAFDDILTGQLGYAVPMLLGQIMPEIAPGPYAHFLDLGCGTGLTGMMLMELAEHAIGVDLSEQMIEMSDERAAYDELYINEAVHFLEEWKKDSEREPFDLICLTDVLPYIGALEPLFAGLAANTTDDAVLAFSSETLPDEDLQGRDWCVTRHQRFAHSEAYLRGLLAKHGFDDIRVFEDIIVRMEQGKPIPGFLIVASR